MSIPHRALVRCRSDGSPTLTRGGDRSYWNQVLVLGAWELRPLPNLWFVVAII